MKINKQIKKAMILLMMISAGTGLAGCQKPGRNYEGLTARQAAKKERVTKTQALKIMKKTFNSAKVTQSIEINNSASKKPNVTTIKNQIVFGGQPTIMQIISQNSNSKTKKNQGIMYWISNNNAYILNKQKTYYKLPYNKMTGHTYADQLDSLMNNYNITNPDKSLVKAESMTYQGSKAQLVGQTTNKALMQGTAERIFSSAPAAPNQRIAFKFLDKYGKYQEMTAKATIYNNQLTKYTETVILKFGKNTLVTVSQTYSYFNLYNNIQLPALTAKAKPMPMVRK